MIVLLLGGCTMNKPPLMVPTSQGQIHVDDGGTGKGVPVVLVHGNGANATQWKAQLDHLRKTRRAVAVDLRGMGMSEVPANGDYSIEAMADDIHTVVEALRIPRFVIVGHSYGGAVVAEYAAKHPSRVAGVVFADAAGDVHISEEESDKFLDAIRADKMRVVRQWYEPILKDALPAVQAAVLVSVDYTPTEAYTKALEGMLHFSVAKAVAAYPGRKLAIVRAANTDKSSFHIQFPDVPVQRIDRVSHWLMMDRPDEFNRILDAFLAEIDR